MLIAGGAAIASNAGFKMNKSIVPQTATLGQNGHYWTALPYFNPYQNGLDFCQKTGLVTAGFSQHFLFKVGTSGIPLQSALSCSAAAVFTLPDGEGIRITMLPGNPVQNIIIVGSHNAAKQITVPASQGLSASVGNFWLSIPYHTTAVTVRDLCVQAGMTLSGFNQGAVFFVGPEVPSGVPNNLACGAAQTTTTNLVLGRAHRLRNPTQIQFNPAHF
jgi:hypothetical protein